MIRWILAGAAAALTFAAGWEVVGIVANGRTLAELRSQVRHSTHRGSVQPHATQTAAVSTPGNAAAIGPDDVAPELDQSIHVLLHRVRRLEQWFAENPGQRIPHLRYVSHDDWLDIAAKETSESNEALRRMAAEARLRGLHFAGGKLQPAFKAYAEATGGLLPASIGQLAPYLDRSIDPTALAGFELLLHGPANAPMAANEAAVTSPSMIVDPAYDSAIVSVGVSGAFANTDTRGGRALQMIAVMRARAGYVAAHGGDGMVDAHALAPYFANPAEAATAVEDDEYRKAILAALLARMKSAGPRQ